MGETQLPLKTGQINPFGGSGIPSAEDIYLAKKKRAQLSNQMKEGEMQGQSGSDFISLESSGKRDYSRGESRYVDSEPQSPIETNLEDGLESGYEYKSRMRMGGVSEQFGYNRNSGLKYRKAEYDYGNEYDFMETEDYLEEIKKAEEEGPQVVEMEEIVEEYSLDAETSNKLEEMRINEADMDSLPSDGENLEWEYERLRNSGIDMKLINGKGKAGLDAGMKEEIDMQALEISKPEEIETFIAELIKNKKELEVYEVEKQEKLRKEIENTRSKLEKIDEEAKIAKKQIQKFSDYIVASTKNIL
ncbi:hypothetical protein BB559_005557 [Furculomyces boomerangus]|uniref:Uncharacterized protein n=1 Tax=Furculomyces boomerangus TaxID=61424 RepID=A0A2T9Y862_9FUNG|nr:hypothetical protein BB559_005557 [Furculomyces boomerangus]